MPLKFDFSSLGLLFVAGLLCWGAASCEDPAGEFESFEFDGAVAFKLPVLPVHPPLYVAPEPTNDSFGPARRWVGWYELGVVPNWSKEDVCPLPKPLGAWQVSRLFSRTRLLGELGSGLPGGLSADQMAILDQYVKINGTPDQLHTPSNRGVYCLYEWAGPSADLPTAVAWLPPGVVGDKPQLVAQSPVDEWLAQQAAAIYHAAVGPQIGTTVLPPAPVGLGQVRVAVLDSSVNQFDGLPGDGVLRHGRDVSLVIREAACAQNSAACPVQIANHLALQMAPDGEGGAVADYVHGGYFGTVGRLAETLFLSVLEWKVSAPSAKLIINMSIGFDVLASQKEGWPQFSAALGALRWVRQAGALPIAAAGNTREGSLELTEPMWPAKAETLAAPIGTPSSASTYRPLAYSAGGRDGFVQPIAVTRRSGKPRLAAYAYSVVSDEGYAEGGAAQEFDGPGLTGSSIAAAVTSAAAAVVWAYRPSWSADDVMATVYSAGMPLKGAADYRLPGAHSATIRLVSVCAAAKAALVGTAAAWNGTCPVRPSANPSWSPLMTGLAVAFGSNHTPTFQSTDLPACDPQANAYQYYYGAAVVDEFPCPDYQLYNNQGGPQVEPQPNSPICPTCTFFEGWDRLIMVANPYTVTWATPIYTNVKLKLRGKYPTSFFLQTVSFDISSQYNPSSTVVVNNLAPPTGFDVLSAEVTGVLNNYWGSQTVVTQQINLQ